MVIRNTLGYMFVIFIILSSIYMIINLVIQYNYESLKKQNLIHNELNLIDVEKTIIVNKMEHLFSDLFYISDNLRFHRSSSDDTEVKQQWKAYADRLKIYDQIRYIDQNGDEVIRINYSEDGSYEVEQEYLQNKSDRYYFNKTMSLEKDKIYVSKWDLNMENDLIEKPIKPMIRIATPFYKEQGDLGGIVIMNYMANDILNQVVKIASSSEGNIFILNADGYWIYNQNRPVKEWTFMYPERFDESFEEEFPDEWENISRNKEGTLITKNGVFNYTKLAITNEMETDLEATSIGYEEADIYIVSYMPATSEAGATFYRNVGDTMLYILKEKSVIFLLLFINSIFFALLIKSIKSKSDKIKYFSEYDVMTGVYNRRAGFEKLNHLCQEIVKCEGKLSICFIDINGLKEVNDTLGHDAGDELITSMVSVIKESICANDFIARLGGDEFLIIFAKKSVMESEMIWSNIVEKIKEINETENRKYLISASHGIEEFKMNTKEYMETIINQADEKMYHEKRMMKKQLKVIRM